MKQTNNSFEVDQNDLYKGPTFNNTICTLKHSQNIAPRIFPPLPNYEKNFEVLKKFQFQYSHLDDSVFVEI